MRVALDDGDHARDAALLKVFSRGGDPAGIDVERGQLAAGSSAAACYAI